MIRLRKTQKATNLQNSITNISSKSSFSIEPPKKVIKALYDYVPQSSVELAFSKGDFFHVIGNENDENWYEACNPATNVRGLVPVSYFQVLGRTEKNNLNIKNLEKLNDEKNSSIQVPMKSQSLYGIVQYDFHAERPDELEAQAGEAIIVIAQSNHEWFVAKPIGRLGGPGLIPISFIEIRDFSTGKAITNVQELVNSMAIPRVEEWKKMTAEYKNNSISLGKFNFEKPFSKDNTSFVSQSNKNIDFLTKSRDNAKLIPRSYHNNEQVFVVSARVIKHVYIDEIYQYIVHAEMENTRYRSLCRYYEDFYNLQVMLLEEFPIEAGRTGKRRILPYMPVPLSYVDDEISQRRCIDLDAYLRDLCKLPSYIKQSSLVTDFFFLRQGDIECNTPVTMVQSSRMELSGKIFQNPKPYNSFLSSNDISLSSVDSKKSVSENQLSYVSSLQMSSGSFGFNSDTKSTELGYDCDFSKPTGIFQSPSIPKNEYTDSFSSHSVLSGSKIQESSTFSQDNTQHSGIYSDSLYIKIKIYFADDLIAIRVPRQITFNQLMEKLQDRLGTVIKSLRFKEEINNHLFLIRCDNDLRDAINQNSKLVLYAE